MGKRKTVFTFGALSLAVCAAACGMADGGEQETALEVADIQESVKAAETKTEKSEQPTGETGIFGESAVDGRIDFAMLQEQNPDIFAWLYVPGTGIDLPVLQSPVSDEYYITHDIYGDENGTGAVYTEMPNLMNMCDFNTVIHGNDLEEDSPFKELHSFEEADFFTAHETFYLYLPDNVLTYEIFAAYYDESSDILRRYDYTTYEGCETYIKDIRMGRSMNRNFREGWEGLTPYHFLVTLDGKTREDGTQYVVIGALIHDEAGEIDRVILDE